MKRQERRTLKRNLCTYNIIKSKERRTFKGAFVRTLFVCCVSTDATKTTHACMYVCMQYVVTAIRGIANTYGAVMQCHMPGMAHVVLKCNKSTMTDRATV